MRSVNIAVTQSLLSGQVLKVGSLRFKPNMKCKTIFIVNSFEGNMICELNLVSNKKHVIS